MSTRFAELAATSDAVAAASGRRDKVELLAATLRRLDAEEIEAAVAFLVGEARHGRVGVGWATRSEVIVPPAEAPTLTVLAVDRAVGDLATMGGDGVVAARRRRLGELLAAATEPEQRLIGHVLGGELRQGALTGVLTAAVARAGDVPLAAVQRAAMMGGGLGAAARAALTGGRPALDAISLTPGRPVLPMLASPAAELGDVVGSVAGDDAALAVDWKLDGARVQVHRVGGDVTIFTRNLNDVTARLPGIVRVVADLPGGDLVLDGEAMGVRDDGSPRAFQDTMGDFGADGVSERGAALRPFFFDVLYAHGEPLVDAPLVTRREALARVVPEIARLPSIVTADVAEAEAFLAGAVRAGHEGVMVKQLDQPYAAGRRGGAWRKVKPVHTLDLVVLAVEWGHGRRRGWLSNVHLGARTGDAGFDAGWVMVGKTFKGMTDAMLAWQTERFLALEIGREGHVVHVRPEQVVEVAVDGVQRSTRYPGGVALRFARVRRYRDDKPAAAADTIDAVRRLGR